MTANQSLFMTAMLIVFAIVVLWGLVSIIKSTNELRIETKKIVIEMCHKTNGALSNYNHGEILTCAWR